MKKIKWKNVLIIAVLIAFLAFCVGLIFGGATGKTNTYSAFAEEVGEIETEEAQDSAEEIVTDEKDQSEESTDKETAFDLEAFLAFVQKYADEAGVGNEYAKAVEAIKTAASEKQVTLSTIASVLMLVVVSVYIIYSKSKNAKLKKLLVEVSEKLDAQVKGTNGLIDESNANNATGAETKKEVAEIKKAMAYLLTGLSAFVDRFNIGAASKESVKREFNRAAKAIDGETAINAKENAENGKEDKAL